ncbi:SCO7613 C-terminal domain-containing membrane protein [Actinoplanes sp. GCM10030250]|uniref:SCO7613 C-terminal domain-containing membrane protein n=1 Tax=Actinoplanes sp. GCM10030250 TaxID=3273376 RepID=UPI00361FE1B1
MTPAPPTYPCPFCGTVASAESGCPSCGRGPNADALEVLRLDAEIAGLNQRLQAVRAEASGIERDLVDSTTRRNAAAFRVHDAVRAAHTAATAGTQAQAPAAHAPTAPVAQVPASSGPAAQAPPPPFPVAPPRAAPPFPVAPPRAESKLTTLTVQNVLFALGGLLLVVAAAVFTAVAWAQVGVTGRALLLGAATAAILAVPPFAVRRGLTAAAETLAVVGLLMILLDGYAAWAVDFLGVAGSPPRMYAATVCAITAGIALGYGRLVGLPGPRIAALLVAQPVLPLAAASLDFEPVGWSLTLTAVTALNVAVLRLRTARFTADVIGTVAYVCGGSAAALAAVLALVEVLTATNAAGAASGGLALMLISLLTVGVAVLARNGVAQSVTGGFLVVAAGVSLAGPAFRLWPGAELLSLAVIALALTAAVMAVRRRLPDNVSLGPWIGAHVVTAVPAIGVAGAAVIGAGQSVLAADPLGSASWTAAVSGTGWEPLVAAVAVLGAYLMLLPAWTRTDLALITLAVLGFLLPAAFGLTWWSAAVAGVIVATVALALAARTPAAPAAGWMLAVRLVIAGVAAVHALIIGLGHPGVGAGVCAALAVAGLGIAVAAHSGPRRVSVGTAGWMAGLLAVPAAVWQALIAADASPNVQVRALFAVVVLLGAVTHAVVRVLPGYGIPTAAVTLLLATVSPVWSLAGDDPVALYAAAALLLIAALLPVRAGIAGAVAVAVPVPAVMLFVAAGADLAVVLLDPLEQLRTVWSGDVPATSSIAWSTVVAVLITALAAGVAALFTTGAPVVAGAKGRYRVAAWACAPLIAVAVPLALAAAGAPWPAVPMSSLIIGLAGLVGTALLLPAAVVWFPVVVAVSGWLTVIGLAGSTPTHGATLAAFGLLVVASAVIGVAGRDESARIAAWLTGTLSVAVLAYTAADTFELADGGTARSVLAAAAVAAALEGFLARSRPREAPAVAAVAHSTALVALLLAGSTGQAAVICTLWSVVLVVRALLPRESRGARFRYALAAAVVLLIGWWLFLQSIDVTTAEVYTLPAAVMALLVGWYARHERPDLPSWVAYGPALGAAFLPTFAVISNSTSDEPEYLRRLLLGLGALIVLIVGARARSQAPVVVGSGALALIALHEVVQFWDLVPRWVPLALGGVLLLAIATTMEQRRRDLLRLRNAVGRMT